MLWTTNILDNTSCFVHYLQIFKVPERLQASTRCLKYANCPISSPSEHKAAAASQWLVNDQPYNTSTALPSHARSSSPHARAVHLSPPVRALHHHTQCPFDRVCPFEEAENGVWSGRGRVVVWLQKKKRWCKLVHPALVYQYDLEAKNLLCLLPWISVAM